MTIDTKTLRSEAQDYFNAGLYRAGGILVRAADTIDSLTHRLEITDDAPGWDGIACRDETIRSQENVIDAQAAEITRLKAAPVWQPIETAPKDGSTVLLRGRGDHRIADGSWLQAAHGGLGAWVWPYVHSEPHHWMPLPAGPSALSGGAS